MKSVKSFVTRLLLVASLMLPWATTEATESFHEGGYITNVNIGKIYIDGKELRFQPSSKIENPSNGRRKPSDLKRGDLVYIRGTIIDDVYFVDLIRFMGNEPS